MSPDAGAALVGDALDLVHRLPLLWKRVQKLSVPAWQARRVAQQAHALPQEGARWVDERLAARTDGSCGPVITDRLVAQAVARFDPEEHERREDRGQATWGTEIHHLNPTDFDGTSDLGIRGDTLTLKAFHDLLCAIAHQLFPDGDTDPLGVRKIKAIRIITALATVKLRSTCPRCSAPPSGSRPARSRSRSGSTPTTSTSTPPAGRVRLPVPAASSRQDLWGLAVCPHARGPIPLARPPRRDAPRHPDGTFKQ